MAAGLGFKTFNTGDVLSAADVNGYLMQGILVFASAAARDAAITSPQEGQFAFLKDTNVTTYYTGSAWANVDTTGMTNPMTTTGDVIYSSSGSTPARLGLGTAGQVLRVNSGATAPEWATPAGGGKVLQVVQATTSTQVINSTSTLADTGLTASITPSSATSKVLVLVSQMGCMRTAAASTNAINLRLLRGATDIAKIAGYGFDTGTSLQQMASFTYSYLDSPATTSSTTYKTQFSNINNGASVRVQQETELSTIILMEIGA
jgi:hypothetical protein